MYKGVDIGMSEAAIITLFSMGIVFVALLLISYLIDIMRIVFEKKGEKKSTEPVITTVTQTKISDNDDEIAVVLSAAVAAMEDEESEVVAAISAAVAVILGKSTSEFVVKNIKRTPEFDSSWSTAGRLGLMR